MDEPASAPFFDQLRRLGWIEGRNIAYERLFALGSRGKMAELARVAAAMQPDLIYAPTAFAASSATKATKTIPVLFATVTDPTVIGLVASLARPGGNATGTFQIHGRESGFEVSTADFSSFDQVAGLLTKFKNERIEVVTVSSSFTLISRRKEAGLS